MVAIDERAARPANRIDVTENRARADERFLDENQSCRQSTHSYKSAPILQCWAADRQMPCRSVRTAQSKDHHGLQDRKVSIGVTLRARDESQLGFVQGMRRSFKHVVLHCY
jgi:hypothetical protein